MVYVDELRPVFGEIRTTRWRYQNACHLIADTPEELEKFARKLQLRKDWKHGDHYDLTANRRLQAIKLGAVPISGRECVKLRRRLRKE